MSGQCASSDPGCMVILALSLRRILGHSSLLITQRYLQSVGVDDLADVHNDFSPIPPTRGGKGYDDAATGRGLTNVETTVAVATGDVRWFDKEDR